MKHCSRKEVIGNANYRESYVKRNCYMVDQANYLVAVYDDVRNLRSGTMQCVRYARKKAVPVILIHPDTARITEYWAMLKHHKLNWNALLCKWTIWKKQNMIFNKK